ncbi:type I restriction-modification system endonuclease [Sporosarcina highlanderae]|uniref:Type I restriction-modification system endonuclease n=1 Tax=Sporosarcina highlanderae TaxID=3035916 RepID=A0ABT8JQD8_9BACL|nr:type I restriction-modification system endonuclease [Sporosarcina highlanderae]MDN4607353.1 type I restriction-modification system endonuclease [Sporosarcina highlanderae]
MKSNFAFFEGQWEVLGKLGESAERYAFEDPHASILKLRLLSESIAKAILSSDNIREAYNTSQVDRISTIRKEGLAEPEILDIFDVLRRRGNAASHEADYGTTEEAKRLIELAFKLSIWFYEVYVDWKFIAPQYRELSEPVKESTQELHQTIEELEKEIAHKERQLIQQLNMITDETISQDVRIKRKEKSQTHVKKHRLSESQTRVIIDNKLRAVGWMVDTDNLNYKKNKTMPEKNKNMAIAEWKVGAKYADYALFIGLQLVGLVEAKANHRDIPAALESQTKTYARLISKQEGVTLLPANGEYKVPFLYATNGRDYLKQLQDQSGIWFWDSRMPYKHAHALEGWHSPEDLRLLLDVNDIEANAKLAEEDITKFGLRYYQQEAVLAAERAIIQGKRKMLLAMATGTGKTRTAIALMYRLIKAKKSRRILFLVDRNSLGQQALDSLKDTKFDGLSFASIYDVKALEDMTPEIETKVQIATVQGMVRRLFYNEGEKLPSVGQYDFIIVDEAHRGYTSDREMSEEELLFRNQNDYVSQYRRVIDYFDAAVLGLTATPALHTTDIFGLPIYKYSYTEAVLDGFLVDHEPPYLFESELAKTGISFEKGEEVEMYDSEEGEIILDRLEDELTFNVEHFNRQVITESFNKAVLNKMTDYIDPQGQEKTLIFAANNQHADLVVRLLKEAFKNRGDTVSDDAIIKITGSIYNPNEMIKRFKNEKLPNIVVTVDLLTTGIDVPTITNLVFLRRIKSRILYDQMLGRATRLCPDIGKTHFRIYDAVGIYNQLQKYTDMKPVVKQQHFTITDLQESFTNAETEEEANHFRDQLIAKIQRKKQRIDDGGKRRFEQLSDGTSLDDWIQEVKCYRPEHAKTNSILFDYLATYQTPKELQIISNHEDKIDNVIRGYGEGNEKPTDYLNGFVQYIRSNINVIPALQLVCTRPKDLTRKDLRELVTLLDTKGFKQSHLQSAWKQANNVDIAADIISFIRQAALGEALVDHETRVKQAMQKVYSLHDWTPRQEKWLERIEKQLLQVPVLAPTPEEAFSEEPFKSSGGYKRLKRDFGDELDNIVYAINDNLYIS